MYYKKGFQDPRSHVNLKGRLYRTERSWLKVVARARSVGESGTGSHSQSRKWREREGLTFRGQIDTLSQGWATLQWVNHAQGAATVLTQRRCRGTWSERGVPTHVRPTPSATTKTDILYLTT